MLTITELKEKISYGAAIESYSPHPVPQRPNPSPTRPSSQLDFPNVPHDPALPKNSVHPPSKLLTDHRSKRGNKEIVEAEKPGSEVGEEEAVEEEEGKDAG